MDEFSTDIEVTEADFAAFDEDWSGEEASTDDFDLSDGAETAEADQQSAETEQAEEKTAEEQGAEAEKGEEQTAPAYTDEYELKHLGETSKVDRAKVVELAQKGLDYDRIRTERDAFKDAQTKADRYEGILKQLAGEGSIDELLEGALAQKIAKDKSISSEEAIAEVKKMTFAAAKKAESADETVDREMQEQQRAENELKERRNASLTAFAKERPDVDAKSIPQSVWQEFHRTGDLESAYAKYENKQLRAEKAAAEQNRKNAARSTGSAQSAGSKTTKDAFDMGWDDD